MKKLERRLPQRKMPPLIVREHISPTEIERLTAELLRIYGLSPLIFTKRQPQEGGSFSGEGYGA